MGGQAVIDVIDTRSVEDRVRRRVWGQVSDLQLEDRGQGVVLRGRARSYHAKQLAQHAVLEAGRVLAGNEIVVA
jgi:hypothetical protein